MPLVWHYSGYYSRWDIRNGTEYDLTDLSVARLGALFPFIMCTDKNNIKDMSNWSPAFLRKVRNHVWVVLDEGLTNVIEELECDIGHYFW